MLRGVADLRFWTPWADRPMFLTQVTWKWKLGFALKQTTKIPQTPVRVAQKPPLQEINLSSSSIAVVNTVVLTHLFLRLGWNGDFLWLVWVGKIPKPDTFFCLLQSISCPLKCWSTSCWYFLCLCIMDFCCSSLYSNWKRFHRKA